MLALRQADIGPIQAFLYWPNFIGPISAQYWHLSYLIVCDKSYYMTLAHGYIYLLIYPASILTYIIGLDLLYVYLRCLWILNQCLYVHLNIGHMPVL